MEIISFNDTERNLWDNFCLESDDAWFWHTIDWMNYVLEYEPDYRPQQLSFFIKNDNKIVAICPLILETHGNIKKFGFSGFAGPMPALANGLTVKMKDKIYDFIFKHIDEQANCLGVSRTVFRYSPLAKSFTIPNFAQNNHLLKYGYIDISFSTQILNLSMSYKDLKCEVRKGHKYDISRASRLLDIEIFDKDTINREIYNKYCQLHHKDAGRITRPQSTFDMMFDWIKSGCAVLIGARLKEDNSFVGFSYLINYKDASYYTSACKDPVYEDMPIAHFILWEAIKWLKENNFKYFELGWQLYGPMINHKVTDKEYNISKFKRGFGGMPVTQIIAEKYYDKEYFEREYFTRINKYKDSII